MVSTEGILRWEYKDLKEFVDNPAVMENNKYEFKQTYKLEAKKLRKCFSSFANSEGGFVFFGIDNKKKICGIVKDNEINTYINRALNNQCLQPPLRKWELIKSMHIPKSKSVKYVYIYYIYPSLPMEKPHIADGIIYIRQNGETKSISSGIELRRQFFLSKFYPEHIELLEFELDKIRDYEYKSTELDIIYLKYLKHYLNKLKLASKESAKVPGIDSLLSGFNAMENLIDEINRSKATLHSSTGVSSLSTSPDLKGKYDNLKNIVDDFIIQFKKVHKL